MFFCYIKAYLFTLIMLVLGSSADNSSITYLSTFDYNNLQSSTNSFPRNFAGLVIDFSQIYLAAMNSTLFQGYITNSKAYGSSYAQFSVSLTIPRGYKYNCSAYNTMGITPACIYSFQPIMTRISSFGKNVGPLLNQNFVFGFDMQGANFSNPAFSSYFNTFASVLTSTIGSGFYNIPIELINGADTFSINNISQNYTISAYMNDMNAAIASYPYSIMYGPGISQNADPSWLSTFNTYQPNGYYVFTAKCSVFKSRTNFTISDILDQANYRDYIIRRFTLSSGASLNAQKRSIVISQMKLSDGDGINGVTNTFAAALWAIDTSIQFSLFGGANIRFPVDLNSNNYQSVLGPAPTYTPNPIYYGLLFLTMFSYVTPNIGRPIATAGLSSNIKAYGMSIQNQLQIVLLNKDTNANASGVVRVLSKTNDRMSCLYLTGGSLNATTNITWAGFSFIGGNSTPQGNYTVVSIQPVQEGAYYIPLAYAQAALCYLGNPSANFPRGFANNWEGRLFTFLVSLMLALFL